MAQQFSGATEDAGGQFLGAAFWKKGVKIEGVVTAIFETSIGENYAIHLTKPTTVDGEKTDSVSIGGLKGFAMALRAAKIPNQELLIHDMVIIECTGFTPTEKGNPQINFKVAVRRG
jgi:hypothetical protein